MTSRFRGGEQPRQLGDVRRHGELRRESRTMKLPSRLLGSALPRAECCRNDTRPVHFLRSKKRHNISEKRHSAAEYDPSFLWGLFTMTEEERRKALGDWGEQKALELLRRRLGMAEVARKRESAVNCLNAAQQGF